MSDSCNPMDCNPPGSSVQGIFQARSLEWVAISFSKESSQPRDWTRVYSELPLITCPNMNVLENFCTVPKQSQGRGLWWWCRDLYHSTCHLLIVGMCWRHLLVPRALFNFFFFLMEGWSYFIEELWERVKGLIEQWDLSSFSPASP